VALVFALTCAAPLASAQASPVAGEKSLADSLQGPARDAYASARILQNNSDFAGALTKYGQAYGLSKDPRLLFDMAICERSLRAYARMQSLLQQFVRESGSRISADDKATVDGALAAIRNLVGTVKLTVDEPGANVAVDGELVGTTPLEQPLVLDLGKHRLVVTKAGYDQTERTIEIAGGSETSLGLTLPPQLHAGHLVITADSEASVSIDDKLVGKGRFDGPLAPGAHQVRVTAPDRRPYQADLDLRDGEMRTMTVTLESEHHGALWPWIVGGAVAAAGAAIGGYFLLKPSDTVTPVPTGKLGGVTLSSWRP
jgi:hypothetical protein